MTENEKEAIKHIEDEVYSIEGLEIQEITFYSKGVEDIKIMLNLIQKRQKEIEKKDKIINKVQEEVHDHIGFENRLKRDNREPDMFNQGRFYVANNINNILKIK